MNQPGALLIFFHNKQSGMLMVAVFLEIGDCGNDLMLDIEGPADIDLMVRNQCQILFCRAVKLVQRAWNLTD